MESNMKLVTIIAIIVGVIFISPAIESSLDQRLIDAAITRTCFQHNGFNIISRWSCRSSLFKLNLIEIAFMCVSHDKPVALLTMLQVNSIPDLCENADQIRDEERARKQTVTP